MLASAVATGTLCTASRSEASSFSLRADEDAQPTRAAASSSHDAASRRITLLNSR
jgi:hypothetical protein